MRTVSACLLLYFWLAPQTHVSAQRTALDVLFKDFYRPFRLSILSFTGQSGDPKNVKRLMEAGKTQKDNPRSLKLICDTVNGPGRRSDVPPTSVHRLRPGDIDIIGAMGDSLTAGNGILGTKLNDILVENRGISWSIGGQYDWRRFLTLPNILKEFNPNLYGYSIKDGISTDRSSRFNVAELAAVSSDMPYMASVLVRRLQRDPHVNMTHHWKMITLFIGNNDFCLKICHYSHADDAIKFHEKNMLRTYRYLRDNVPRLMLNVVLPPNLRALTRLKGLPPYCIGALYFECPCLLGKTEAYLDFLEDIIKRWIAKDSEIANRDEFNTDTFTINVQHFAQFKDFERNPNGTTNLLNFSSDCFHLSQNAQATSAFGIWNNLLEKPSEKTIPFESNLRELRCPTEERPYFITRVNSRDDFVV